MTPPTREIAQRGTMVHEPRAPDQTSARPTEWSRYVISRWLKRYLDRQGGVDRALSGSRVLAVNPICVLRRHLGELPIRDAKLKGNTAVEDLLALVQLPCSERLGCGHKAGLPPEWASQIEIICSS